MASYAANALLPPYGGPSSAFGYNTRIPCGVMCVKARVMMVAVPARQRFAEVVGTEEELRALLGQPSELVIRKQMPQLDEHCRAFIALSPFLLLGTADAEGNCDVSPRGDAPGFVLVLDQRTI